MKRKKKRTSPERQTVFFHLTDALIPSLDMIGIALKTFFHILRKAFSAI
ncbi:MULTISPECIES: hypothetical protein [Bacillus]|nr:MULTISPECIES: hypothetical protein [Bacillus]MCY7617585.1 hypothetical protein [Bacillus pumilus]MDF9458510.1 hypothetical protein [Bacillus pumilus]QKN77968.1 hypothetical protein GZ55_09015 [Bacillus pumilus]QLI46066.1 hypothetical protein DJ67_017970 [Bacillus pumilus]QNP15244.1 hypothetical protein H9S87_11860 [Bacillus pumilus]